MSKPDVIYVIGSKTARDSVTNLLSDAAAVWEFDDSDRELALAREKQAAPACTILVVDKESDQQLSLGELSAASPLVAVLLGRESLAKSRDFLLRGAHEVIEKKQLSRQTLMRAILNAQTRYDAVQETRDRETMFMRLCDTLPFQMAYRIVVKPGQPAKFVYVSEGIEHISGLQREDVLQNPERLYEQILDEDKQRLRIAEEAAVRNLAPLEIDVRKKDAANGLRWVHIRSVPTREADGTIVWDGVESNITAYKNVEEALKRLLFENQALLESERHARTESERTSRIKDEFLATLSHELRTPINSVLGWIHLIKGGRLSSDEVAKAVDIVERNARTQAQLIEDLLDMNRIISGKVHLRMESVDIRQFIRSAVESIRPTAEVKGIALNIVFNLSFDTFVLGDSARLQQVLWNLLSNAVKFTPQGGEVEVRVARRDSEVELSIKDSGIGIKPEFLPYMFDRFRQADSTSARQFGGLGLGLAIVKHLTQLHGGSVEARSAGEGRGATLFVRLPILQTNAWPSKAKVIDEFPQANVEPAVPLSLEGIRILLVDDERDALDLMSEVLAQSAASVTTAQSTDEALRKIESDVSDFDVIISDIGMPNRDGCEFLSEVRRRPWKAREIPAIALTAFARAEDRSRTLAAGYQRHVSKPVDAVEFPFMIAALLGRDLRAEGVNI